MSRETRKALIQSIQEKRKSKVICYITSDRDNLSLGIRNDIVPIIHKHILSIDSGDREKIDLLIYSRGGDSDTPWSIVSMFREYCEEGSFSVLIPFRAHSAATVIALGADEIVMTKKAELGPIDITIISGPYNPKDDGSNQRLPVSVEDVMGYFSLIEGIGCKSPSEKAQGFEYLVGDVHPLILGRVNRLLEQTKLVALRLLETRANPFSMRRNKAIVKRLSSEIFSHMHTISRTEAINQLGLKQVVKAEDLSIDDELWQLYLEYRELFSFEEPFRPDEYLIQNNVDEHTWDELGLICVESENLFSKSTRDIKIVGHKQVPPQVTLNVGNFGLPPLNIGNLPPGITPDQLAAMIDQMMPQILNPIIQNAAEQAAEKFLQALPYSHFERIEYNVKWEQEE